MSNEEIIRLVLELKGQEGLKDLAKDAALAKERLEDVAEATKKVEVDTAKAGRTFIEAGRFLQDFSAAGINGVSNNIEGMLQSLRNVPLTVEGLKAALTSPAGFIGAVTFTLTALAVAAPKIKEFFSAIVDGANKVPEAADNLGKLNEALEKNKKELDELKGKQSLTNTELEKYNRLLAEQPALQKAASDAKKKAAENDKLDAIRPAGAEQADRARAENLQADLGGNQGAIEGELAESLDNQDKQRLSSELKDTETQIANTKDFPVRRSLERKANTLRARLRNREEQSGQFSQKAKDMLSGAMVGGREEDLRNVVSNMPLNSKFLPSLEGQLPENVAASEAEFQKDEQADQAFRDGVAARKKRRAEDKKTRDIELGHDAEEMKLADDNRKESEAAKTKHVQDSVKLGRSAGKAFEAQNAKAFRADSEVIKNKTEFVTANSSIDERAAYELAQMRQAGGGMDKYGRFRRMTPDQQDNRLRGMVNEELATAYPRESKATRARVGMRIAEGARNDVNDAAAKASAQTNDATIRAVGAAGNAMSAMATKMATQERVLNDLAGRLNQFAGKVQKQGRSQTQVTLRRGGR